MTTIIDSMVSTLKADPRFDQKVILVTGATSGIGRALALKLAKRGATVILLGRNEDELDGVYDEILSFGGATPSIIIAISLTFRSTTQRK